MYMTQSFICFWSCTSFFTHATVLLHEQSHCLQSICPLYTFFYTFLDPVFRTQSQISRRLIAITWNDFSKVFSKSLGGDLVISDMGCFCPNPFSRLAVGHLGQHGCKGHLSEWRQASPAKGWLSARAHAMRDHIHKALFYIYPWFSCGALQAAKMQNAVVWVKTSKSRRYTSQEGIHINLEYKRYVVGINKGDRGIKGQGCVSSMNELWVKCHLGGGGRRGGGAAVAFPSSFPDADSRAQSGQEWILSPSANNVKRLLWRSIFQFPPLTICPRFMRPVSFSKGVWWWTTMVEWFDPVRAYCFEDPRSSSHQPLPPTGTHHYSPHTPDPDSAFPSRNPRIPSQRPQSGSRLNGQDRQQPTKGNITMLPWHFFFLPPISQATLPDYWLCK